MTAIIIDYFCKFNKTRIFSTLSPHFHAVSPYHRITVTFSGFWIGGNNHIYFILYI